jgi:hypothetical protein
MRGNPFLIVLRYSTALFVGLLVSIIFMPRPELLAGSLGPATASGVKIECITPDGHLTELPNTSMSTVDSQSPASIVDDGTIDCALRAGETTFIIALPENTAWDGFTFVNENAAACGELRIAVSESLLPADSPQWTKVDGIVPFAHKRLFKLSMLGVQTKFVRLSFHVENGSEDATNEKVGRISTSAFHSSALADAVDSSFANLHAQRIDLVANFGSVAPLSSTPGR